MTKSPASKKTAATRTKEKANKATTARKAPAASLGARLGASFEKIVEQVENIFSARPQDIISALMMDHDGIRILLGILDDKDRSLSERRRTYELLTALLKSHTVSEEQVVYKTAAELSGRELHLKIAEGLVEHHLAEDLMKRLEGVDQALTWSAHANVLAEIVEHHLKEEERDLFPLIRKESSAKAKEDMLVDYLALREKTQPRITKKNAGVLKSTADKS